MRRQSPIPVLRSFVAGSRNAGSGFSPRSVSTRRRVAASLSRLRPHSLSVASAAFQARRNVALETFRVTARPGRVAVAAARVGEEVQLIRPPCFHADQSGLEVTHERGIFTQELGNV